MKSIKNQLAILSFLVTILFFTSQLKAQVTIGSTEPPSTFSLLELSTNLKQGGLRMPQLTVEDRDNILTPQLASSPEAVGLIIYNTTSDCLEFWNGSKWVSLCKGTPSISAEPASIWLSPSTGNSSKTVTVSSSAPWTVTSLPTNATLSASSGPAGTTVITLTRNETVYGLSSFEIKNSMSGDSVIVPVDNYYLNQDDQFLLTNNAGVNTESYQIYVYGGDETFTVVSGSYPNWITSATVLPGGMLQLTANQSPDGESRTGEITLAHANDPSYQVTIPVLQSFDVIPPFEYMVLKFTWTNDDVDIQVEFTGDSYQTSPPFTYPSFVNEPYSVPPTDYEYEQKAVGFNLRDGVVLNGDSVKLYNYANTIPYSYVQEAVSDSKALMLWGGDAKGGQGETAFFKAPLITPADPMSDNQNLPRYITLDAYCGWWTQGRVNSPVTLNISTYKGGIMVKPTSDNTVTPAGYTGNLIYTTNFYNVPEGSTPAQLSNGATSYSILNPPSYIGEATMNVTRLASGANWDNYRDFRNLCQRFATITYDRYRHSALVTWYPAPAPLASPPSPSSFSKSDPKLKAVK